MDEQPITELARVVVARIAPGELSLFGAMSRAYTANPGRARVRLGGDEALGFGLAETAILITPVALAAAGQVARMLAEEFSKSLAHMASDAVAKHIAALFRREPGTAPLSQVQLSRIREAALRTALAEKLTEPQATLLADALTRHLASPVQAAS